MDKKILSIRFLTFLMPLLLLAACSSESNQEQQPTETVIEYRDRPSAAVSGEVAVPQGMDSHGVHIYAEGTSYVAYTDSEGEYVLSGLPVGEYRLRAYRHDLEGTLIGNVTVEEEDLERDQPFRSMPRIMLEESGIYARGGIAGGSSVNRFGSLQGRVETPFPSDAGGVLVSIENSSYRTATLPDGSFQLPNVEPGDYDLRFSKIGFTDQVVDVSVNPRATTTVPPVSLSGSSSQAAENKTIFGQLEVLNADGTIPNDFSIFRVVLEGTSYTATPDSSGQFEIDGIRPGTYTVSASAPGYILDQKMDVNLTDIPSSEVTLTLLEDTTEDYLNGVLIGKVLLQNPPNGSHAGISVSLVGTQNVAFTDPAGNFRIEGISEGTYDLMAVMSGYESGLVEGVSITPPEVTNLQSVTLQEEVDPPYVVATVPSDGQTDVMIRNPTVVTVQFSERMDENSVANAIGISPEVDFRIFPVRDGGAGASTFDIELNAIPRERTGALRYDEEYRVTIGTRAQNLEGVSLEDSYQFRFTTGPAMIIGTYPQDESEGVVYFFNQPLVVYFNAPIDRESIDRDDIRFDPPLSGGVNIYFERDPETGWTEMELQGKADFDREYEVRINRGVRTVTGQRIDNTPYEFSFRTRELKGFNERYGTSDPGYDVEERERRRQ